jgi:hypothetical protein
LLLMFLRFSSLNLRARSGPSMKSPEGQISAEPRFYKNVFLPVEEP